MTKIQQFHRSIAAARKQIAKWKKDPFSSFAKDYGDSTVTSIKLAKKGIHGGKNVKVNGRRLYNINMRKRKK